MQTDVVIVGAGPTGLLLAIELVLGGARVVVVERLEAIDETLKAGAFWALAGEALERRGLKAVIAAEEAAARAQMEENAKAAGREPGAFGKIGGHFAGLFLIDQARQREPDRRLRFVRQSALERRLVERAAALSIEVRRGTSLVDFRPDADGVSAMVDGPSGPSSIRCAYIVGCDGGRSTVRKRARFDFLGTAPTITGYQALVDLDHPDRLLPLGWRRTESGTMAYGPIPGRILLTEFGGAPEDREAPITRDELEGSLRRVSGADVRIIGVKSATRFTDNARQATSYRIGRVLIAGDAAHVHSPYGGQGLNLSLLDAVNLGWKLAAVVGGRMPEALLDTYTQERHPVGARVLANTRAQIALMRPDAFTGELRAIVADLMQLDEGNRYFGDMMSGVTTRYDLGSDDPQVGRLCPDLAIGDGGTLYDHMQEGNGVLLNAGCGEAARIVARWAPLVHIVPAQRGAECSLLLRPDACIAWAAACGDTTALEPALARWFGAVPKA